MYCSVQILKGQRSLLKSWVTRTAKQLTDRALSKDSADAVSTEQWKSTKLPNFFQKFFADNICSADETGLFHHATLVSYKHATLYGSKKAMDHVNMLCCSNMSQIDTRKLWLLGKMLSLDALRGIEWTVYQFCTMLTRICE